MKLNWLAILGLMKKIKIYLNYSSEKQLIDNINARGAPDVFTHLVGVVYDPSQ